MKDSEIIYRKVINYMYQSMCKTVDKLPFSGHYWLEQFIIGVAQYVLDEYGDNLQSTSKRPVDVCRAYLNLLTGEGFLNTGDYRLKESGDEILVYVDSKNCVYKQYCSQAREENLPFSCVRLAAFQAVLRKVLDKNYSSSIKIDWENGICYGKLFLDTKPKEEIVTRQGHKLKIAGRRAILLPQETFASLLMSVREHAPHALKHVLYDVGYRSGSYLARKARVLYSETEECLQLLLEEIKNEGLGKVELVSYDLSGGKAKIRCYDSFQVAAVKEYGYLYRTPQVICDLLRGIFAAYLTVLMDKEIICEEMSCQSVEGNYCEFLALPLPQEPGGEEETPWLKE